MGEEEKARNNRKMCENDIQKSDLIKQKKEENFKRKTIISL